MNRKQIAPGVFVTALSGSKFNRCKISVHMLLPGQRETATAFAVLPNILNRSCADIPDPVQFSRYFFEIYGADLSTESYQVGENRVVSLSVSGIKNIFALAGEDLEQKYLEILSKIIFRPKLKDGFFDKSDVEIEKAKQEDLLKSEMNNKRSYVLRQARRKLFGDSPHGIESAGYLADIEGLSAKFLHECYSSLLQESVFEIIVSGIDSEKTAAVFLPYINERARNPRDIGQAEAVSVAPKIASFSENMDTAQGKLCLLFSSGKLPNAKKSAALRLGVSILGALPTSRLFANVREKQGLCYYCAASSSPYSGTLCIDSGIDHENAQKATSAIMHELETMQQELVTKEELDNAKLAIKSSFTAAADSLDAIEAWVFTERLKGTNLSLEEAEKLTAAVTREDIKEALAEFVPAIEYVITKEVEK